MKVFTAQIGMLIRFGKHWYEDVCPTIQADALGDNSIMVVTEYISTSKASYHTVANLDVVGSLVATDYKDPPTLLRGDGMKAIRRLTPLECTRLQGFPDYWLEIGEWTDSKGKKHKGTDTEKYKALGNSIALPYWKVLARRIAAQYDRDITIASLFDGIGGFPLAFSHCGATPVWASEIEEYPMAVTKVRFPEKGEENG